MEWEPFEELPHEYPEIIISDYLDGFDKATKGRVNICVVE